MASDNELLFKINLKAKLDNLEKMIAGFDKAAQKAGLLQKTIDRNTDAFKGKFSESQRSLNQLNGVLMRTTELYRTSTDPERMKAYAGMIDKVRSRMLALERETQTCTESTKELFEQDGKGGFINRLLSGKGIGIMGGAIAAGQAARWAWNFGKESSEAAAEVEKYNVTLKTMLGSTGAARDRMQEYFILAKKTPFELSEVVEGGNKLQAIGRYSAQNLTMLGDLAAASGKPLEQVMTAYSKLVTGQKGEGVNMFRDLLISVQDWTKATGKGVSKNGELLATTEQMIAALPKIMQSKGYFGMMANQAETTKGKLANLEDGVFQLKMALGERLNPTVNHFAGLAGNTVEKLQRWVEIPLEQKIARERFEVNGLIEALIENIDKEDKRSSIIDELNRKYPEILKNIDTEKVTTEELRKELEKVNGEYDKKMRNATYQRMVEDIETEIGVKQGDIDRYAASLQAKKEIPQIYSQFKNWVKEQKLDNGENHNFGNPVLLPSGIAFNGLSKTSRLAPKLTPEQEAQWNTFSAQLATAENIRTIFGNDQKKIDRLNLALNKLNAQKSYIEKLAGVEPAETTTTTTTTAITTPTNGLDKAADSISAGGKSVKNFNITIHDGLIKQVDNHFNSTDETPDSAGDFLWRLSGALQMILNDVNYSAA